MTAPTSTPTSVKAGERSPSNGAASGASEKSLGELVATATADISTLLRKEVELAKVELKAEAKNAGKGAGAFGAAGITAALALLFLSISAAYGFGSLYGGDNEGLGFLTVGLLYLLVAGVAALVGRKSIKKVGPPEKTIETVKDDVAFAKHPTSAPTRRT